MANFYTDNEALKLHLNHPMMKKIVELKERNFADADKFDYAPQNFEDAMDSYDRVLDIVGEICGDIIAENAEDVDHNGPRVENSRVIYAEGTKKNLDACRKAGLMGMSMPRRLGGLNFPITPYIMAADMVSRADAGSRTSGDFRTVPRQSMSLPMKHRRRNIFPVYVPERQCRWTLPSRMPDPTFSP